MGDALETLEFLQRKIVLNNVYPDPDEYYEPLKSLIESIEPHASGRKLTPELLLQKFQSDGKVVDISCLYSTPLNVPQNHIG